MIGKMVLWMLIPGKARRPPGTNEENMGEQAFSGLKVLERGQLISAPLCAKNAGTRRR